MSDAAISSIVTGVVTVATMLTGFLTLWIKLKFGEEKAEQAARKVNLIESKVDHNTNITEEAKAAAEKMGEHTDVCEEERRRILETLASHNSRITSLETQLTALKTSVDGLSGSINSTRHEMRGHLQTVTSKLDIMTLAIAGGPAVAKKIVEEVSPLVEGK